MLTETNSEKTAKWRTIARLLLQRIYEQQLTPGDKLPPERELAEQLGVSRTSVREALRGTTRPISANRRMWLFYPTAEFWWLMVWTIIASSFWTMRRIIYRSSEGAAMGPVNSTAFMR